MIIVRHLIRLQNPAGMPRGPHSRNSHRSAKSIGESHALCVPLDQSTPHIQLESLKPQVRHL